MMRFSYAPGAVGGLLAAGPICIAIIALGTLILDGAAAASSTSGFAYLLPLMIISIPFGLIIALLPVLLAGYALGRVGVSQPTTRHPALWGAAGAIIGMLMALAIGPDWRGSTVFALTGALCALIVRYGTRWFDETA